jgi:mono/diheme cytochrome c family protein
MPASVPIVVATTEAPAAPSNVGLGQVVLLLVALAVLVWVAYLVLASRRARPAPPDETPMNLQPYLSDDELENKRLNRVLGAAVISAAVLAVSLPVYYVGESRRQVDAAEAFAEKDTDAGGEFFETFLCIGCHGADAGGGGAAYNEARSGLATTWAVPSLNDVFYRYSEDEVRFWVVYGRAGTPMPPNGLEGGGPMTGQEVDQVLAYLHSVQLGQDAALAKTDAAVAAALTRLENADVTLSRLIRSQQGVVDDLADAPDRFAAIEALPGLVTNLLSADGSCTAASAALVDLSCARPGADTDRDGLTDEAETVLAGDGNQVAAVVAASVVVRAVAESDSVVEFAEDGSAVYEAELVANSRDFPDLYSLELDPEDSFTTVSETGEPIADLAAVETFANELDTARLGLSVATERNDVFLGNATAGYTFLVDAYEEKAWAVDFDAVATATGLGPQDAERAVGLFNAYCARCHTAGYSAGIAYQQPTGSGAWGPALEGGRAVVQFPDEAEHVAFVISGSNQAESYGVNGIGRGWMPGFGQLLTREDIELIVKYERSL